MYNAYKAYRVLKIAPGLEISTGCGFGGVTKINPNVTNLNP